MPLILRIHSKSLPFSVEMGEGILAPPVAKANKHIHPQVRRAEGPEEPRDLVRMAIGPCLHIGGKMHMTVAPKTGDQRLGVHWAESF